MKKLIIVLFTFMLILSGCSAKYSHKKEHLLADFSEVLDTTMFDRIAPVEKSEVSDLTYNLSSYLDDVGEVLYSKADFNHKFKYDTNELYLNFYTNTLSSNNLSNVFVKEVAINGEKVEWALEGETLENLRVEFEEGYQKDDIINIEVTYSFMYLSEKRLADSDPRMASHKGRNTDYVTMFYYPIVAMRNDSGWQTDAHSDTGEVYYNDVKDYNVKIKLHSDYVVAHSGVLQDSITEDEFTTHQIFLAQGRDFSFSASKDYNVYEKNVMGVDVKVVSYFSLGKRSEEIFQLVEDMFIFNEKHIGPYIYDTLTLEYGHIYGMESTSITYQSYPESLVTTIHEVYHQYFYSMIGSNQGDEPFLDEGLTSFMTGAFYFENPQYTELEEYFDWYGTSAEEYQKYFESLYGGSSLVGMDTYQELALSNRNAYGFYCYWYPTTVFKHYIETYLDNDPEPLYKVFRAYYAENVNQIATVEDFFRAMDENIGVDGASDWFREVLTDARYLETN